MSVAVSTKILNFSPKRVKNSTVTVNKHLGAKTWVAHLIIRRIKENFDEFALAIGNTSNKPALICLSNTVENGLSNSIFHTVNGNAFLLRILNCLVF